MSDEPRPRQYINRFFGFHFEDRFVEGALFRAPADPRTLDMEGNVTTPQAPSAEPLPYTSLMDLRAKLAWTDAQLQSFTGKVSRLLSLP